MTRIVIRIAAAALASAKEMAGRVRDKAVESAKAADEATQPHDVIRNGRLGGRCVVSIPDWRLELHANIGLKNITGADPLTFIGVELDKAHDKARDKVPGEIPSCPTISLCS